MFFKKKDKNVKEVGLFTKANKKILECIEENRTWLEAGRWEQCHGCDYTAQCKRMRKRMGIKW